MCIRDRVTLWQDLHCWLLFCRVCDVDHGSMTSSTLIMTSLYAYMTSLDVILRIDDVITNNTSQPRDCEVTLWQDLHCWLLFCRVCDVDHASMTSSTLFMTSLYAYMTSLHVILRIDDVITTKTSQPRDCEVTLWQDLHCWLLFCRVCEVDHASMTSSTLFMTSLYAYMTSLDVILRIDDVITTKTSQPRDFEVTLCQNWHCWLLFCRVCDVDHGSMTSSTLCMTSLYAYFDVIGRHFTDWWRHYY